MLKRNPDAPWRYESEDGRTAAERDDIRGGWFLYLPDGTIRACGSLNEARKVVAAV